MITTSEAMSLAESIIDDTCIFCSGKVELSDVTKALGEIVIQVTEKAKETFQWLSQQVQTLMK